VIDEYAPDERDRGWRRSRGISDDAFLIGSVGRLSRQKNFERLIRAFKALLRHAPQARLVIAGEGRFRDRLNREIRRRGVAGRAELVGYQAPMQRFLGSLDCFALLSRSEGIPNVVLEAAAMKVPVIVSAVDGNTDVIEDGKTGLIVKTSNGNEFAEKALALMRNDNLRKTISANARRRVERRFSFQERARIQEGLYERLCSAT
jgi:glycosyltransferase involved in cell wall biosynthesis